mgnify:FL=1
MTSVLFVCTGNICRSAMAAQLASAWAENSDIELRVDSAGVSDEEHGNPMDRRAVQKLTEHGYQPSRHSARQVRAGELADFDLVLAFEPHHLRSLQRLAPESDNLRLVTDFDPQATPGSGIADPWYGRMQDFEDTYQAIVGALPGIFADLGHPDVTDPKA